MPAALERSLQCLWSPVAHSTASSAAAAVVSTHRRVFDPCAFLQALPKGGWWSQVKVSLTEYDLHILRALLAMASAEEWAPTSRSYHGLHSAIVEGQLGESLYDNLHAVTAMVFARMASAAVGEHGRARSRVLRPQ